MIETPDIPFSRPCFLGPELDYVRQAVESGGTLAGGGLFNKTCERILGERLGSPALLTTSGTHALELAAMLLDLKDGDEIIAPSFTFVSSVNAFLLRGARPRFVDNDRFGNIDLDQVEAAITPKTRAVAVVHYAGNSCDMERLAKICRARGVALVEDAAQSLGARYSGKPLGTFGAFGCVSFHDTKNLTCGEGGALIVNDRDKLARAEILREKGTNRSQFLQGLVDKYTWIDVGSSYVLSELNAAYLLAQLERIDAITEARGKIWKRYREELAASARGLGAELLDTPPGCTPNYHAFGIVFASPGVRAKFIAHMKSRGVTTPFHYVALHTSPYGKKFLMGKESLANCMRLSDGLVRLPIFHGLGDDEQTYIIKEIRNFADKRA
ncbi:MAG: dTDP-4-amino-4,6-dideoxygalactose transaminase [Deltaproteobacteria bacterium]|nr:dTDP-4-amino-4,6-dideoxygalactose transaminase [Deltaproteobacteria bacterium]